MANWNEFSKAFYKSTKRELINSGKPVVKKKEVYAELKKKFKKITSGTDEAISMPIPISEGSRSKISVSSKPRILSTGKIKKSNIEFLHKFYKLTSKIK